jgi:hypothetical protein
MSALDTISRRTFMSAGASLLATAASLVMLPRVYAATAEGGNNPVRQPSTLPQHSLVETRGGTTMEPMLHTTDEMDRCIQICQDCHALCVRTIRHCLELGGRHAAPEHIRLLVDCAQMCQINVDYMLRGSSLHERVCGVCSEACKLCAENCAQLAGDDQMLKQCADLCRRCAGSCERMASKVAA